MFEILTEHLHSLLVVLVIFTAGIASPGPATLMIVGTAMSGGRSSAVVLSLGVVAGSVFWAIIMALGFVALIEASVELFVLIKVVGALYLFYLAYKSLRSALRCESLLEIQMGPTVNLWHCFVRGLLLHLTNPKAMLVWLATLSIGLGSAASMPFLVLAISLCGLVAIAVYVGYAILFSTKTAARLYESFRRPFEGVSGLLFGVTGIIVLTVRSS